MAKHLKIIILTFALAAAGTPASAQSKKKPARASQTTLANQVAKAKQEVIKAANEYKASLEKLLVLQERDVKTKAELFEKRKDLLAQNIISKLELEKSKQELDAAQAKVNETRKQMGESDNLIAEARAAEQLAKMPPARVGAYQTTAALIRYNGPSHWALADASKVQSFFLSRFRRSLPISAFGQTEVHNRLGFDHSNSIDVAVHPDNPEGQALMSYLRSAGIPFIAFRQAVPGSATGAHIHIGYPSHRISR
ncbi:MAG TPA: hypothetical protein VF762_04435 [Blastocatellia bacterium]|jgi:methylphosphotriester-DNA--protein-cysteine methyltransferase